nr:MAG TPA: hypothetical protein [Caudoviricetes sp.]
MTKSHEIVTNLLMILRCNHTVYALLYQRKNFFKIIYKKVLTLCAPYATI